MTDTHDFNDGNGPVPAHRHAAIVSDKINLRSYLARVEAEKKALEAQLAEAKEALKLIDELNNLGLGVGNIASSTLAKLEEKK